MSPAARKRKYVRLYVQRADIDREMRALAQDLTDDEWHKWQIAATDAALQETRKRFSR